MHSTDYDISPRAVRPLHHVRDPEKLAALVASMRIDGWTGRPILAYRGPGDDILALTASHRLAAARVAGLDEIPVLVLEDLEDETVEDRYGDDVPMMEALANPLMDDEDRLDLLVRAGAVGAPDDVVALMRAEIVANRADDQWLQHAHGVKTGRWAPSNPTKRRRSSR
jgi:hypothetical protein